LTAIPLPGVISSGRVGLAPPLFCHSERSEESQYCLAPKFIWGLSFLRSLPLPDWGACPSIISYKNRDVSRRFNIG